MTLNLDPGIITWANVIDWVMQFVAIIAAVKVGIAGWHNAAAADKKVRDAADRQLILQVLNYALHAVPVYADKIADDLDARRRLTKYGLQMFDMMRSAYNEHWPKVHTIEDEALREGVLAYFFWVEAHRPMLDLFSGDGVLVTQTQGGEEAVVSAALSWRGLAVRGRELTNLFAFKAPTLRSP